jgi:hypothetical protein
MSSSFRRKAGKLALGIVESIEAHRKVLSQKGIGFGMINPIMTMILGSFQWVLKGITRIRCKRLKLLTEFQNYFNNTVHFFGRSNQFGKSNFTKFRRREPSQRDESSDINKMCKVRESLC